MVHPSIFFIIHAGRNAPQLLSKISKRQSYWSRMTSNTPETRVQLVKDSQMMKEAKTKSKSDAEPKKPRRLFADDGRPLNVNESRIPFKLFEDDEGRNLVLDVAVYRYLDTSYLDVDIQPTYVKVLIKGKILQICHNQDISIDKSTAKRSTTTGHLLITMPLMNVNNILNQKTHDLGIKEKTENSSVKCNSSTQCGCCKISRREMLEIGPSKDMDFSRIIENDKERMNMVGKKRLEPPAPLSKEKIPSADFVDDPDVPPLE